MSNQRIEYFVPDSYGACDVCEQDPKDLMVFAGVALCSTCFLNRTSWCQDTDAPDGQILTRMARKGREDRNNDETRSRRIGGTQE